MLFDSHPSIYRCDGVYKLVVYQARFKPEWIRGTRDNASQGYVRYGHIEGIDADKIAYATQASEAAYIVHSAHKQVMVDIMRENYNHTDENLYISFTRDSDEQIRKVFPDLSKDKKSYIVRIEFEVKHMYFDNLIKSVSNIDPVIIRRLLPQRDDFLPKSSGFFQYKPHMHGIISQLDADDQLAALKTIALCPPQSPPILINGSFGSGKTRVLACAAYYITEMAKEPARVLLCAHHQASADSFVESYFGDLLTNPKHSWQVCFVRLTSNMYTCRSYKFSKFYMNTNNLRKVVQSQRLLNSSRNLVIATTFFTALRLRYIFSPGFFTHILLDEGAQSREAEAIAPLSLASSSTQIVIAGDSSQVSTLNYDYCYRVTIRGCSQNIIGTSCVCISLLSSISTNPITAPVV